MKSILQSLGCVALLFISASAHAMFSGIYVFGDSLSDGGNAYIGQGFVNEPFPYMDSVPSSSYAPFNVFSNGPVWVQYLADDLGLPLAPSFIGGTNFALGGERTGDLMFGATTVAAGALGGVVGQAHFASSGGTGMLPSDALYIINGGGNDIRRATQLFGDGTITDAEALAGIPGGATNLANAVSLLAAAGAQTILVSNVPDVGRTPDLVGQGAAVAQLATDLAVAFNAALDVQLTSLQALIPSLDLIALDTFALTNAVIDNPGAVNVTDACTLQNGGNGCADPNTYLFWDGIHPTTAAHRISADAALAAVVPLPAAGWLLLGAIGLLAGRRRAPA
jgi:outer membrane lipase/esterase